MNIEALKLTVGLDDLKQHFLKLITKASDTLKNGKLATWIAISPSTIDLKIELGRIHLSLDASVLGRKVPLQISVEHRIDNAAHPHSIGFVLKDVSILGAGNGEIAGLVGDIIVRAASEKMSAFSISYANESESGDSVFWIVISDLTSKFGVGLTGNIVAFNPSGDSIHINIA